MTKDLHHPILLDGETHAATDGAFALTRLGRHAIRGRREDVDVFALPPHGN